MWDNKSRLRELSMRMALKIADLVKVSADNWRNLAESTVMKRA
jgi:plasmid maintenance system antidote protein VapI